jgi:hypothetical protein
MKGQLWDKIPLRRWFMSDLHLAEVDVGGRRVSCDASSSMQRWVTGTAPSWRLPRRWGIPPVTHPTDPSIHVCRVGRVPRNPPELEREWVNPRDHLCMVKVPVSYFREDGVLGCRKTPLQRVGWILPPPPHPSFSFFFFFFLFLICFKDIYTDVANMYTWQNFITWPFLYMPKILLIFLTLNRWNDHFDKHENHVNQIYH